jgi:hypothetical protein
VGSFVRHQDVAAEVGGDDGGGAAFHENLELFFGFLASVALPLQLA